MHAILSAQPHWETTLAPRLLLGLWHPKFLAPAKQLLPYCRRSYIGADTTMARRYFWDDVEVFSMLFASLATADGEACVSLPLSLFLPSPPLSFSSFAQTLTLTRTVASAPNAATPTKSS